VTFPLPSRSKCTFVDEEYLLLNFNSKCGMGPSIVH